MSVQYSAVYWNPAKKIYDTCLAAGLALYFTVFLGLGAWLHPNATIETLLIRACGTAALLLLHVILCIGPACRLDRRFLPLLYNRRHLGVTMFFLALAHGAIAFVQFHALGDVNPLRSLLDAPAGFQQLGLAALFVLFLMAATSHDFWLKVLTPRVWKSLHMGVYAAYTLLIAHVAFGVLQSETHPAYVALLVTGMASVITLHLTAARKEFRMDNRAILVCDLDEIPEGRAVIAHANGERVAVFKHQGRIAAVSNLCAHQNGPIGEGQIVDGCITCPWHGYQYLPETGMAPPPFTEKLAKYPTRIVAGKVYLCGSPE